MRESARSSAREAAPEAEGLQSEPVLAIAGRGNPGCAASSSHARPQGAPLHYGGRRLSGTPPLRIFHRLECYFQITTHHGILYCVQDQNGGQEVVSANLRADFPGFTLHMLKDDNWQGGS